MGAGRIAPMTLDLHLLSIWAAAYLAAGSFYVLRGLGQSGGLVTKGDFVGLGLIAFCWLPITVTNLTALSRLEPVRSTWSQIWSEAGPPLTLLVAIVATAS